MLKFLKNKLKKKDNFKNYNLNNIYFKIKQNYKL